MLKRVVGSLAISLLFVGCGVPPDEEDDWNAMPTQEELLEDAAAAPKQLASFASGAQTRRETGIYTWKVHKNEKNFLYSGYNKNGKRMLRHWIWATGSANPGVSSLFMGHAAKITSFGKNRSFKVHVGSRMSAANRQKQTLVENGMVRDFKKQQGRYGCLSDTGACVLATISCAKAQGLDPVTCGTAILECTDALESCIIDNFPEDVGKAIEEAIDTMDGVCLTDPLQRFMCQGT